MEEQMIKLIASTIIALKTMIPTIIIILAIQGLVYQISSKKINIYKSFLKCIGG